MGKGHATAIVATSASQLLHDVLIASLWLFAFVALVFEPLYYFGCSWEYANCQYPPPAPAPATSISSNSISCLSYCAVYLHYYIQVLVYYIAQVWAVYGAWDPLFLVVPVYLRVMCVIEVVIFGPCYALCAMALTELGCKDCCPIRRSCIDDAETSAKRVWWRTMLLYLGLPFCGALVYSTVVYFAMEWIEGTAATATGFNLWMVFVVNIPWTIVPVLLVYHIKAITADAAALMT